MWLGDFLAQRGYIVAAVNHHGNTAAGDQILAQGFALVWERPEDLTAVLTKLLADPVFGNQIHPNRIGAVGHSAGGANVVQLAGGIYDSDALIAFCNSPESQGDATCEPRDLIKQALAHIAELKTTDPVVQESFRYEKESHRDPRVKASSLWAPAIGPGFTQSNLAPIHIPVQIVVGDADDTAPPTTNAAHYAKLIKGAKLTVLPHVGHSTFGSECTQLGEKELPTLTAPSSTPRKTSKSLPSSRASGTKISNAAHLGIDSTRPEGRTLDLWRRRQLISSGCPYKPKLDGDNFVIAAL